MLPRLFAIDQQLHKVISSFSSSKYINPTNISAAYSAFMRGERVPPFSYVPLKQADELLYALDAIPAVDDHPFDTLFAQKIENTRLLIYALRDRSPEAFHALAKAQNWFPDEQLLKLRFSKKNPYPLRKNTTAQQLCSYLEDALHQRRLTDWDVVFDSCMSARVLVQSAEKKIYIQKGARFYEQDLPRLVIHEIDVHAQRSINGAKQPLRIFQTGLPQSILTEEGLAMLAEKKNNLLAQNTLADQTHIVWAINQARHLGFRELYEQLKLRVGPRMSWIICLRIKRGLAQPGQPGVYAKDSVYLKGYIRVQEWLRSGGDIRHLYVGSVDISHPIEEWLKQGWVTLQSCPFFWSEAQPS